MTSIATQEKTFDASDGKLGRLASDIAQVLLGKSDPGSRPNVVVGIAVKVINASKLDIGDEKLDSKIYLSWSGYPGGQKERTAKKIVQTKGYAEIIRKAVYGMLPSNKLRKERMKNLTITE